MLQLEVPLRCNVRSRINIIRKDRLYLRKSSGGIARFTAGGESLDALAMFLALLLAVAS